MNRRADLEVDTAYVPPTCDTEKMLVDAWTHVLDLDEVGIHDNFFELGGDSLGMMQTIFRIAKLWSVDVPVETFFDAPTVQQLAAIVEAGARSMPAAREWRQSGQPGLA
jgi:acyl carrier protein